MVKINVTMNGKPFDARTFTDELMAEIVADFEKDVRNALAGIRDEETGKPLEVTIRVEGTSGMTVSFKGSDAAVAEAQRRLDNLQ